MAHTINPTIPASPAAVNALLAMLVPDGSDTRQIESVVSCLQSLLNLAAVGAAFVGGGTVGDGTQTTRLINALLRTTNLTVDIQAQVASLIATGASQFNGGLNINGGNLNCIGGAVINGSTKGNRVWRYADAVDADHTYDPTAIDMISCSDVDSDTSVALTANRIYTINDDVENKVLRVRKDTTAFQLTLKDSGGITIAFLKQSAGFTWVDLKFRAALSPKWRVVGYYTAP